MNTKKLHHTAIIAIAAFIGSTNAAIIATTSQIDQNDPAPVVSNTDLGQTAALSYSATGQTDFLGVFYVASPGEVNQLFNGEVGNTDGDANDSGETVVNTATNSNGSTFTINFDVATNTLGYDITEIFSVAGWNTSGGGRSNQGYDIDLTFVDNSTAKLSSGLTWIAGPVSEYWTTVSLTNNGGGVLSEGSVIATGVKSITFSLFDPPPPGGFVSYREFDIIGTATIPEPSTFALLGLAGLAVFCLRRRR